MSVQTKQPQPKIGLACQSCRSRKVRCLPNPHTAICLTCERSGTVCEWAQQRARPRKKKLTSKARISALESRLEQLVSEVAIVRDNEHPNPAAPTPFQTSSDRNESSTSTSKQGTASWAEDIDSSVQEEWCAASELDLEDALSQHDISLEDAERYLVQFREMTLYFPFVVLPAKSTLSSLSEQSPMLLLAALTAASSSNKSAQALLEKTLRVSLLENILLSGEKSLDLLAALLVYLAWYHFYCIPKIETFTQLIQLAISMCLDLGLHLKPEEAATVKIGMSLQHYRAVEERAGEHDEFFSCEARRLLLGCYHLSCRYAVNMALPTS